MNLTQDQLLAVLGHLNAVQPPINITNDDDRYNHNNEEAGHQTDDFSFLFPEGGGAGALEWQLFLTIHEPGTIALTVLYSLSFLVGMAGNVLSIRVLCGRRGSERLSSVSSTRVLLVNLAVCDLAVVCVCMPVTLASRIYVPWVWGGFLCRAVPFTQAVSVAASVLSLTVISVNRYLSVRCPLRARSLFTRRRILAAVAAVWAVSASICAPLAVMMQLDELRLHGLPSALPVCSEAWPRARLRQGYNVLLFAALYCLPVSFNLAVGFLTGRRLWLGRFCFSELDPRSRALHAARLRGRRRIARLVLALVLLFAASWLPLYVADLWLDCGGFGFGGGGGGGGEEGGGHQPPSWLLQARPFAQWLGLTNSSLNPICYCLVGDLHRSARQLRARYQQRILTLFGGGGGGGGGGGSGATSQSAPVAVFSTDPADGGPSPASALALASLPKIFSFGREETLDTGEKERPEEVEEEAEEEEEEEERRGYEKMTATGVENCGADTEAAEDRYGQSECITFSSVC
ncbi:galanin receptor type 3 [Alosa sapidissima]|uniref:galanin receptor type 3 n=1 Tax=Alosa sapidissima TaxID=34773 RepID=UPI001C08947F|nr:galanin receptor type 3 [Alosa sapidissima]